MGSPPVVPGAAGGRASADAGRVSLTVPAYALVMYAVAALALIPLCKNALLERTSPDASAI